MRRQNNRPPGKVRRRPNRQDHREKVKKTQGMLDPATASGVLLLVASLGFAATGCGKKAPDTPAGPRVAVVHVKPLSETRRSRDIQAAGVVAPWRTVALSTQVQGKITRLDLRVGQQVKKGQILVRVSTVGLYGQSRAARARIAQITTDIRKAERDVSTARKLFRSRAGTRKAFEDAEFRLASLKAQLSQAKANLGQIGESYRGGAVRAPFAGIIAEKKVEQGDYVVPGQVIGKLVELRRVLVTTGVAEHDVSRVNPSTPVTVRFPALGENPFAGKVHAVSPTADTGTGAYTVEIKVANHDGHIRGGMTARVTFTQGGERGLFAPVEAVRTRDGKPVVFILGPDGKRVERRSVTTGLPRDGTVRIASGVSPGEHLVVSGISRLQHGTAVRVASGLHPGRDQSAGSADVGTVTGGVPRSAAAASEM